MRTDNHRRSALVALAAGLAAFGTLAVSSTVPAVENADVAIVLKARGRVDARKAAQTRWVESIGIGYRLDSRDRIKALDKAMAAVMFTDDRSLIKVQANTELEIQGERREKTIAKKVELDIGGMFFNVAPQKAPFQIITPTSVASVKGSVGFISYTPGGPTLLSMLSGLVVLRSNETGDTVAVNNGQTGSVSGGGGTSLAATTAEVGSMIAKETSDMLVPSGAVEGEGEEKEIIIEFRDSKGSIHRIRIPYSESR